VTNQLLATKLYIPPVRANRGARPRLLQRLDEGLRQGARLTLISAPAGFGKTTLVGEWIASCGRPAAWLSLDAGDNDPAGFLAYLIAALQTAAPGIGAGVLASLQAPQPQPPNTEWLVSSLLNELAARAERLILALDDTHVIEAPALSQALTFLIEHLPPQLHVVIATREDPPFPLARWRARGQLTELRAADLRFTPAEAAEFLNRVMGLNLSTEDIAALEARTEGWIVGLQLAALSMQGHSDTASFIRSFTGNHRFVLDYLVEEVLGQQTASVQAFLLRTSILDRMCGPLCDAVMGINESASQRINESANQRIAPFADSPFAHSHALLEHLDRANLFIVPLDNERRWYRYHHLFAELLRQRLGQSLPAEELTELHLRVSAWYERNGLVFEAFQHAAIAHDVARAERLIGSKEMNLHLRSVALPILNWLAALPKAELDARPGLWVRRATLALMAGLTTGVAEQLQTAEKLLQGGACDENARDLIGRIACARATLAFTHYDLEAMVAEAQRALEYLDPSNLSFLFTANWVLTTALGFKGERGAAAVACQESLAISKRSGEVFSMLLATHGWGTIQELDNRLHQAAETYRHALDLAGEHPLPHLGETHLGLARIYYEWNDLKAAERHGQRSLQLARQYDPGIDRFIVSEVFLARLELAQSDVAGAAARLAQAEQTARQRNFALRLPDIAAVQVLRLLRQGQVAAAAYLVGQYDLPLSQARVFLAQGETAKALAVLEPYRRQVEEKGWQDERLRVMALEALALYAQRAKDQALQLLAAALALAEPGGFIRLFVDEGEPMRSAIFDFRLSIDKQPRSQDRNLLPYVDRLLAAFQNVPEDEEPLCTTKLSSSVVRPSSLVEPLSQREVEILKLIAQGLANREIGERLFLALDTVKGHNRRIFDKLQVQSRTEAIARARELGLL